jgi:hypothetical protein
MVSLAELKEAKLDPLYTAATAYDTLAGNFQTHAANLNGQVVKHIFDNNWIGTAAGAAESSLQNTSNRLDAAHTEMSAVAAALRDAADAFGLAQGKVQQALTDAQNAGITVADDGSVSWPKPSQAEHHDPDYDVPQQGHAIAGRISDAVAEATTADERIAKLLDDLTKRATTGTGLDLAQAKTDLAAANQAGTDLLGAGFPGKDAAPTQVLSWWNSLSPDEQQRLINHHPDLIGNRNGIPSLARDQANRINLVNLTNEYANKPQPLSDDDQRKLDGFRAIQTKLDQEKGKQPPALLIGVSDEGQGRGILSYGNPDPAQNTSVYVPGLGTKLADAGGKDADRALNVWTAATKADPSASTASMVWLGYDPPPGLENLQNGDLRPLEVMSTDRANAGAVNYDQFMGGLRATHDGAPGHLVALGHSYGSTTVGLAAQQPGGTGADDIILVGSPGTGADNASQLNIDPHHVWVGDAENDPVSHLPSKGEVGTDVVAGPVLGPAADWVYNQVDPNQLYFGTDPASSDFGANRFQVADGESWSFSSHSNYMNNPNDPATQASINNIGQIVAGHGNNVTRQGYR